MDDWDAWKMALDDVDAETAELIIQLRLEDLSTPEPEPVAKVTCSACSHEHPAHDVVKAPCEHDYCAACLENLYRACMTDESLFPPRCCRQPFPWELVRDLLSQELQSAFAAKRVELETQDRTYCHVATCSAFIPPDDYVADSAPCPKCQRSTCIECKRESHTGVCGEDDETEEFLATARQNGCLCGAQFCYLCAATWKTCPCAQWDEERLLERAAAHVNNAGAGAGGHQAPNHAAQVARAAEHLRENHECEHGRWTRRTTGSLRCEECRWYQQRFVDECDRCHLRACYRCRTNRL
ncbi:hypothetical protein B0A55_13251 [Friedmanniomyces simplex]|uniref:IBR domain-containing protein n=1 Tax=Friedmanniomyces simplex TaxID=329884 RepID=A0A4U0VXG1_9PEZI|nr:hypothetical protein B0A55_13251 [Friedmanniomyces simplex]